MRIIEFEIGNYKEIWKKMIEFTETRTKDTQDELWITEHNPIYTLGKNANENNIIDNETFLKKFKEENLKSVIGKKNTLVIADTNGFHHGKKLTKNHRIMLTASYTSKKPSVKINNSLFE